MKQLRELEALSPAVRADTVSDRAVEETPEASEAARLLRVAHKTAEWEDNEALRGALSRLDRWHTDDDSGGGSILAPLIQGVIRQHAATAPSIRSVGLSTGLSTPTATTRPCTSTTSIGPSPPPPLPSSGAFASALTAAIQEAEQAKRGFGLGRMATTPQAPLTAGRVWSS